MFRIAAPALGLLILLAVACTGEQPAAPLPTPDIQATVTAMVEALPTQPPPPTLAALPTYTPAPSATPYPTHTPVPSATPYPTYTPPPSATPYPTPGPLPTHTPYPTLQPPPTYTPWPTLEALPTYTPQPRPAPVVRTVTQPDNWKVDSQGMHTVLGNSPGRGTWLLAAVCLDGDDLAVWLWHALGRIYSSSTSGDESLLAEFDGDSQEQTWHYFAADEDGDDALSANWPRNTIAKLIDSKRAVFTVPTAREPYVVTFDVAGLDRHIKTPEDLCR